MVSFVVGVVMSIAAAFSWGSSMVIFKVGVKNTSPLAATYIKGLLAIPILLPFLKESQNYTLKSNAALALGRIGKPETIENLFSYLGKGPHSFRIALLRSLSFFDENDIEPIIQKHLISIKEWKSQIKMA